MKILVTVGTTKFESLIKYIDIEMHNSNWNIELQIADGKYIPRNYPYFLYLNNCEINKKYADAELIITHAGCGTIYKLLEMRKKLIIVPNLERSDKHQLDLANYIDKNNFALVAYSLVKIEYLIKLSSNYNFRIFTKDNFFKADEIIDYILI
jgi:beta-1,4-N-acetylglucosaminyltransferase